MVHQMRIYIRRIAKHLLLAIANTATAGINLLPGSQTATLLSNKPNYTSHGGDGLSTIQNAAFLSEPAFQAAYNRGVRAAGWDFGVPWRVHVAIWAALTTQEIEGSIVELGTGRGFVMSAVLSYLDHQCAPKEVWLFDRFSPYEVDQCSGEPKQSKSERYATDVDTVKRNFSHWPHVNIVQGTLPDSLKGADIPAISFLHIDLNAAEPEVESLIYLWSSITSGGIILLDDYCNRGRNAQHEAMGELGAKLGFNVLSLPTGQGLVFRL